MVLNLTINTSDNALMRNSIKSFHSRRPTQLGAHFMEALWEDMPVDIRSEIVGEAKRNSIWKYLPKDLKDKVRKWHEDNPEKRFA